MWSVGQEPHQLLPPRTADHSAGSQSACLALGGGMEHGRETKDVFYNVCTVTVSCTKQCTHVYTHHDG